jgi:hypothetical protein
MPASLTLPDSDSCHHPIPAFSSRLVQITGAFRKRFRLVSLMPRRRRAVSPLPPGKADLIPVEIFSEIFLFAIEANPPSQRDLMLVCRRWRGIMLSIPGIHIQLRIRRSTQKKDVEAVAQGRRSLLDVTIDINDERYGSYFNARYFYASFMAAAQVASRWRSLALVSLPPAGEYMDLQIVQPLQYLESFKLTSDCNLGNFLEPLMTAIAAETPRLTVMELADLGALLYLVQPPCSHVFHSLKTLKIQMPRRMGSPVDLLPHLERLETFQAHHLCLPVYPPNVRFRLLQTMRTLHLKSVSVQWMTDQSFPVLQECSIISPIQVNNIRSVNMPSCSFLKYDSNNLGPLEHFHLPALARLEVKCDQWSAQRGNMQLVALHLIRTTVQQLTCLHLQVQCSEQLLVFHLRLIPTLRELWLGLARPHALGKAFFQAFVGREPSPSPILRPSSQATGPRCRGLEQIHLHYKRWLRGVEKNTLIPAFGDIVASRRRQEKSSFSFCLSFDEGPKALVWEVNEPAEGLKWKVGNICIGCSSRRGIVPLSANLDHSSVISPLFKESEYLQISIYHSDHLPIDFLFPFNKLKELRIADLSLTIQPSTQLPSNLFLFHTLEVLHVRDIHPSLLASQPLHKLKRCSIMINNNQIQSLLTEMPVCTRLVLDLSRLAALKLPQIGELGVFFDHAEPNRIWDEHIAVNANLSRSRLLHIWGWDSSAEINLLKILRYLPVLKTLVITMPYHSNLTVECFRGLVPKVVQGTSGRKNSHGNGQNSVGLCPGLESLQIEKIDLDEQPELIPVLKDIVSQRAVIGFPLKSFTFYKLKKRWELIGKDGAFTMREAVPAQKFWLKI